VARSEQACRRSGAGDKRNGTGRAGVAVWDERAGPRPDLPRPAGWPSSAPWAASAGLALTAHGDRRARTLGGGHGSGPGHRVWCQGRARWCWPWHGSSMTPPLSAAASELDELTVTIVIGNATDTASPPVFRSSRDGISAREHSAERPARRALLRRGLRPAVLGMSRLLCTAEASRPSSRPSRRRATAPVVRRWSSTFTLIGQTGAGS
jgi:hypothetical protein